MSYGSIQCDCINIYQGIYQFNLSWIKNSTNMHKPFLRYKINKNCIHSEKRKVIPHAHEREQHKTKIQKKKSSPIKKKNTYKEQYNKKNGFF